MRVRVLCFQGMVDKAEGDVGHHFRRARLAEGSIRLIGHMRHMAQLPHILGLLEISAGQTPRVWDQQLAGKETE